MTASYHISQTDDNQFSALLWPYPVVPEDIVLTIIYEGDPLSKQRPYKKKNGKFYVHDAVRIYTERLALLMRNALQERTVDETSRFALRCLFYRSSRQRIDCDNLLKAVSDVATGLVWKDDSQVTEIIGRLFLVSNQPRAEIVIYRVIDPSPRKLCPTCGKPFITYPSQNIKHCSVECATKPTHVTCTCRECGKEFEIVQSLAKRRAGFCSRSCSMTYHGRIRRAKGRETWLCQDCGAPVSRKEYQRCRACSMKHRQEPTSNYWRVRYGKE